MHTWSAALRMDRCGASSTTPFYIILLSVMLRLTLSRGVQACCTPICGLTPRIYGLAQIIFWDLVEAKEVHSLRGHGSATVTCVACHPKAGDTSMVSKPPPLGRAYSNKQLYSSWSSGNAGLHSHTFDALGSGIVRYCRQSQVLEIVRTRQTARGLKV